MDNKGQISIELIIVIAAILAVALILIKGISNTATRSRDKLNDTAHDILDKLDKIK